MITIDLSKQQTHDPDPKVVFFYPKINFTANVNRPEDTIMFYIIEDTKETIPDFSQGNVKLF